jgi:hypothetical protein
VRLIEVSLQVCSVEFLQRAFPNYISRVCRFISLDRRLGITPGLTGIDQWELDRVTLATVVTATAKADQRVERGSREILCKVLEVRFPIRIDQIEDAGRALLEQLSV